MVSPPVLSKLTLILLLIFTKFDEVYFELLSYYFTNDLQIEVMKEEEKHNS